MSINFGCNIVYLHLDRHVMLTCYLRHTVTSIICLVFLYSDFSYNISKLHLTRSVFESFRSQPKIEPELNSCNELSKIVFKVKLGSFVTAQRGCGAHFRYVGPLTLWWVRTHFFFKRQGQYKSQFPSLLSHGFPRFPFIDQPAREDEQLGDLYSYLYLSDCSDRDSNPGSQIHS